MFDSFTYQDNRSVGTKISNYWDDYGTAIIRFISGIAIIAIVGWLLFVRGDVSEQDFARLMHQENVTNVERVSASVFSCGQDDFYVAGFRGIKNGQPVKGSVCGGFFKYYTIRYE